MRKAAAILALLASATGCADPSRLASEVSFRTAVTDGVVEELRALGHTPDGLTCRLDAASTEATVHVTCADRRGRVEVRGTATRADTRDPRQEFVVRLDGKTVISKNCLGHGCPTVIPASPSR
ncbi:hypothetical protein [Rhizohabitans arisaemae]|uniref:hypothetical protein n=1 Tax=Rhizohabitans arisaemae TaxID=2720610 RepID=UPI0024B100D6|nr:hypothetical protein [Rhizohabitans arisaemae]